MERFHTQFVADGVDALTALAGTRNLFEVIAQLQRGEGMHFQIR